MQSTGTPKTVVIATGDAGIHARFSEALRNAGHRTFTVHDGDELLGHVQASPLAIDLVVLDLRVDRTRLAALRMLRGVNATCPIVVLSGSVQSAQCVRDLAELGVRAFVNEHSVSEHILPSLSPELFPENFNRRTSMRVTLDIPVVYRFDETIATAPTLNLSKGGLGNPDADARGDRHQGSSDVPVTRLATRA